MSDPKELSVAEAARATGYSRQRLYQMLEDRQIAARKVRARADWRIPLTTVEELKARKAQERQP